jgi:hypothetical protein
MPVAGAIYLTMMVLVMWAGRRGLGSRWAYVVIGGAASVGGMMAIILSPSSNGSGAGLGPRRPWSEALLTSSGWLGGGLLLLGFAALVGSMLYRMPSAEPGGPAEED